MQGFACGALSNMALKNSTVAAAIGESGAIEHIVHVMRQHLASSGVQHGGCGALASLCIVDGNVELIEVHSNFQTKCLHIFCNLI